MNIFKKKPREYIISYSILSKMAKDGNGSTQWIQLNGEKLDYSSWMQQTKDYWNKEWSVSDVVIVVTNIFENK